MVFGLARMQGLSSIFEKGNVYLFLFIALLSIRSETRLNSMQMTAIDMPLPTLPCSNCRFMYVETVSVLVGAMREGVTSSLKAIMKVIIHPDIIPRAMSGSVICMNEYRGPAPQILPAAARLGLICE